jgi:tetratricopeptide (TPR) repeat protein/predicted Ser/Thr protein kinase
MYDALQAEQRQRWQQGDRVRVQSFLDRFPALRFDTDGLSQLVCNEIVIRDAHGDAPCLEEYLQAFPGCSEPIRRQFALFQPISLDTVAAEGGIGPAAQAFENRTEADTIAHGPAHDPAATMTNFAGVNLETVQREPQGSLLRDHAHQFQSFPLVPGFEILSELGRGGMGVVYRAKQLSANRIVALKVVRNELLDTLPSATRASTLERFRTEAQAAAQLQHDNLVSVYEIGEAPPTVLGGSPLRYYAMRFVQGRSLFEIVREGPLDNRRAASYMEPVARALHAAHEQGILHRDLKPHNIMVDLSDDRPLVTDFGLAKFIEGNDAITYAGEIMGTPSYMSPEQATDAGKVTASADLYSLGATLYHLLTGRAPFQASNVAETIRQIIHQEPVSPRQLNAAIDRDLETICLKCLQKDPSRRYASCADLAKDLHLYLTGCPIIARPVGRGERLWRWCRRNPIPAALTGTALALALATMLSIVIGYRNTTAALAASESRLQRALQVVDELFTRVSEDELLNEPGMQPLRKDLLEKALKHYQYFLSESGGKDAIRDEVAASHFRIGVISQTLGQYEQAERELLAADEMQRALLKEQPNEIAKLKAVADTLNALGNLYHTMHRFRESLEMFQQATKTRDRIAALEPSNDELKRLSANTHMNLGLALVQQDRLEDGLDEMEKAQASRSSILKMNPELDKVRRDLAKGWYSLGKTETQANDFESAISHFQKAIDDFETLRKRDPRSLELRFRLSVTLRFLGGVLGEKGDHAAAIDAYTSATSLMASLASSNPDVSEYQVELAILAMNRGTAFANLEELPRAIEAYEEALLITRQRLRSEPDNPDVRYDLAAILGSLGGFEHESGNLTRAQEYLLELKPLLLSLKESSPTDEWLKQQWLDVSTELDQLSAEIKDKNKQSESRD